MKKCSFILSDKNENKECPFGLPITKGCLFAGSSVSHMCPLSLIEDGNKKEKTAKMNKRVYLYYADGTPCLYAANILEKFDAVNCNFGDTAQGMHAPVLEGSPLYAQTFGGTGLDGLYAFPLGFYGDNNTSRNLFQGLFSLVGSEKGNIIKQAASFLNNNLIKKIDNNQMLSNDEKKELNYIVSFCYKCFEDIRDNPVKIIDMANKCTFNRGKQ